MTQPLQELGAHVAAAFAQDVVARDIVHDQLIVTVKRPFTRCSVTGFMGG